jgi:hypothetical protein
MPETDSSDAEWSHIEPHLPTPETSGRPRGCIPCARSSTPSSTSCVVAVLGACCRTISLQQEDRTTFFRCLAFRRHLGEGARRAARSCASPPEEEPPVQRRDSGQPVGQDRDRAPPTEAGSRRGDGGDEGMGEGVRQRGGRHRHEEGAYRKGPESLLGEEVDRGAHLILAFPEQEALSKDYERLSESSEVSSTWRMSRLMARILARS